MNEWFAALLADTKPALTRALTLLATHRHEVRDAWRRKLERFFFSAEEIEALSGFPFDALVVGAVDCDAAVALLERQGQSLAARGVSQEHARSALFFYLESALPYVAANGKDLAGLTAALVRLTLVASDTLAIGFSSARATSWRSFDEKERHRLSRDLHDEIGHDLVVLKLYLEMISKDVERAHAAEIAPRLGEALDLVTHALQSVRRLILDLGPAALEGVGLLSAVRLYARQFTHRTGVKVHVRDAGVGGPLPASHETALYRVLQGALSNVIKHAQAHKVHITLGRLKDSVIIMVIEDDGVGFDTMALRQAFGMAAMRERIQSLGGRFHVQSWPVRVGKAKHGTRIEIDLPLPRGEPDERKTDQGPGLRRP